MEHTYLRYECADTFGLTVAAGSSKAPLSNSILAFLGSSRNAPLLTAAGSVCLGINLRSCQPTLKLGHREQLTGGVGTGRALNGDEIVCLDVLPDLVGGFKVATGWVDGTVRIFELSAAEVHDRGLIHSLIHDNDNEDFVMREPLVLNGHNDSPVRTLAFDSCQASRLASGGTDGSVVLWDVVAETGLFRLLGHRGGITDLDFVHLPNLDGLTTTSLDGTVKVWDLRAQCCCQTLANHKGEVWSGVFTKIYPEEDEPDRWRLVTGSSDGHVHVWGVKSASADRSNDQFLNEATTDKDNVCALMGSLIPPPNVSTSAERIQCIRYHPSGRFLGVLQHNSKSIDIYTVRTTKESERKRQRRLKRRQEKSRKQTSALAAADRKRGILDDMENDDSDHEVHLDDINVESLKASDEFEYLTTVRSNHKIRGFTFCPLSEKSELSRLVCALSTNALIVYSLVRKKQSDHQTTHVTVAEEVATVDMQGHPTGIRSIALSSDDALACTVSKNATKIWNVANRSVLQSLTPTIPGSKKGSCYGLCAAFLPGNSHVVIGTREGHILVLDIAAGEVVHVEDKAHGGAIWSIDVRRSTASDSSTVLLSGSADKAVKFWNVEVDNESGLSDTPVLVHTRTLQMVDDVVAVKYSNAADPAKRFVIVSTLDSTIKIFFDDSLRLFLSLYGHKLPALAVDASDDDILLASSSADKTVKIWGLDFGDTHRTLHGHEDSVTDIRFVRHSHNFFTASKDGTVRFWDGDRFEQILLLTGHFAEVNCLAVSRTGAFVLSGSMDRQVRVWERTKDIVFVEEERERRLEKSFDRMGREEPATITILERKDNEGDDELLQDASEPQSEAAVKKSVLSVAAGDRLLEALERADEELKEIGQFRKIQSGRSRPPNPMLLSMDPPTYILWVLRSIKHTEVEQSLLLMPLSHLERLLFYIISILKSGRGIELCARVTIAAMKIHQNQILTDRSLAIPLRELRKTMRLRLEEQRDIIGYNLAALKVIGRIAHEQQQNFLQYEQQPKDIWAGLGLGSDVAAALEGRGTRKRRN